MTVLPRPDGVPAPGFWFFLMMVCRSIVPAIYCPSPIPIKRVIIIWILVVLTIVILRGPLNFI